ncbi:MAG: glycoside hydrolase family 13 protein [Clostridia bacterium]|nr:glycoside hydrolase family 13 protein [Clostridia bacterium]
MLTKITVPAMPVIKKNVNGADASLRGAFAAGEIIIFTALVPRRLGASAVVLRICRDGERDRDLPLTFVKTEEGVDEYSLSLDTAELCPTTGEGLFFYEFLFLRGLDTLFTSTQNQVDFTLERYSDRRFVLLVYEPGYTAPDWFRGRVMYHIFVDRFCRGEGEVAEREDVILNEDWENGIPQYAKKNGDRLANNMFFGGNLWGIAEKLGYLKSLGVGVLYLSPIFRAYSNHKYDTGDYLEIDGMFGGEAAFRHLLEKAKEADIRVILDGVFNHTGDNSRYFDRYGEYGGRGAYSDPDSPYRDWYRFRKYPDQYENWWGIDILPKLNPENAACREFLVGKGGVCEKYVRMGIGGWRLDVADELSDPFLDQLRQTVKTASDGEGILIGEVWENAALKEAYGHRRRYFRGRQLDSVMNYPVRNGILQFVMEGNAEFLADTLKEIYATYPRSVCDCLMNLLGTHDTERILTVLGEGEDRDYEATNDMLATKRLTKAQLRRGVARLKMASALQYTVYGVPSVFYGDEAGLEGYHDPFCRRPFPWGRENKTLLKHYRTLGKIRAEHPVFVDGDFRILCAEDGWIAYVREGRGERITVLANAGETERVFRVNGSSIDLLTGASYGGTVLPGQTLILCESLKEKSNNGTF